MGRFADKVIAVTGAGSGVGKATATRYAADGGTVIGIDINGDAAEKTGEEITAAGGIFTPVQLDVTNEAAVATAIKNIVDEHGKLDVVANIAGIGGFKRLQDTDMDTWNRYLNVNITGPFLMCREAMPHLLESGGAVCNIGSIAGVKGQPFSAAYCASKGAVIMLTRALAVEFGRLGVRINAVCPGGVDTPLLGNFMPPSQGGGTKLIERISLVDEMARPEEIANAVTWITSDEASYVNGSIFMVDKGCVA